jgi:glycerol-3-phosphate dehydrogenase (NAD(P)+)
MIMDMTRTSVIGAGAWGTALAAHAARLGHETLLWAREPEVVEEIERDHRNTTFLHGVDLPPELRATGDLEAAVAGADLVLLVVPSQHLRAVAARLAGKLPAGALVIVAAKGIEEGTLLLMSQVVAQTLPGMGAERLAVLSGPSFAREVARGLPTDVVVASEGGVAARRVQPLLHSRMFRVYSSADPVGVQLGGALKNIIAVAAGVCDGLELGDNARAAVITRGLMEIARLGVALGASPLTFLGMAGVGDLVLTCTGDQSRNRTLGKQLAEGADAAAFLAARRSVAEGFSTASAALALARKAGVDMPITEQVVAVLHEGRSVTEAFLRLVDREHKDELHGLELFGS